MHTLTFQSAGLWRQTPLLPPPPGSGPSIKPPVLTQLRILVEEVNTNSLVVRSGLSSRAAANATRGDPGKRKTVPGTDGTKGTVAKGWASNGAVGPPFKSRFTAWGNPPANACGSTWTDDTAVG